MKQFDLVDQFKEGCEPVWRPEETISLVQKTAPGRDQEEKRPGEESDEKNQRN